ncbi:MAG: glycosyltransferase family 4 protein [Desulfotomaculaceae bacterium]|nr:glycosyltransferase family 4 protein [Desulfotomaculaceae bacterium]
MQSKKGIREVELFFVDPMSYHNLAGYDYELLSNINKNIKISFYANEKLNISIPNADIKKIYHYSQKKGLLKIINYIKSQIILLRDIRKRKPDIVHFQWLKLPPLDYLFLAYIKKYSRIIYTSHDALTHFDERKYKASMIKILKIVDQVIVHTPTSKRDLTAFIDKDKIAIIKHGLLKLEQYFKTELNSRQLKIELNIGNEIVFSALGTMDYYKGTDLLIEAWQASAALSKSKKVKLIIAGKNKMGLNKEAIRAENVIFIDRFIPDEEFIALLKLSDLILMPYRQISQSGLLLTAIAEGKKVLVSTAGELTQPFKYGNIGWILQQNDPGGLRALLEGIVEHLEDVTRPVEQAIWSQIKAEYDWAAIGAQTSRLYLRIALDSADNIKDLRI